MSDINEIVEEAVGKSIGIVIGTFLIGIFGAIFIAIPLTFFWKAISQYFAFLPEVWLSISYWKMVSLLYVLAFVLKTISRLSNAVRGK